MQRSSIIRHATGHWTAVLCLSALIAVGGCAGSARSNGGRLSDAMEKASDDNTGSRTVATDRERRQHRDDDEDDLATSIIMSLFGLDDTTTVRSSPTPTQTQPMPPRDSSLRSWISLAGGTGLINNNDLYGINHGELRFTRMTSRHISFSLMGGIDWSPVQTTGSLSRSLDGGLWMLNLAGRFNWHTTPPHTFLGQYFFAGGGYSYMFWKYRNNVVINGRYVGSDGVDGLDLFCGVGLNVVQVKGFQLGAEFTPGAKLWFGTTSEGLTNDVFTPFGYGKFTVVISF